MDFSQYNTRVIQEPRGMIRIITLIFAILAFATTSGFDSFVTFKLTCPSSNGETPAKGILIADAKVLVEYPFEIEGKVTYNKSCNDAEKLTEDFSKFDFSSSAQFYVATGVLSFLYSTACLVLYIFGSHHYETNPLLPVIDLVVTAILTVFWLAGASAWAAGVSDLKYYMNTDYLFKLLKFCDKENVETNGGSCLDTSPAKFTSLNISLIFGFANIFLWAASVWFVFKETQFHRKPIPEQMGVPGQPGFDQFGGQMGGQMGGQQQMPGQTTHFPQQRQFADGY